MWALIHHFISPQKYFRLATSLLPWFTALFILLFSYGLIDGLFIVPADYLQGDGFRIIYVHAPCAFLSLFIYSMMALAAFVHIVWRIKLAPLVVQHSATIGATFTFLSLVTGSLWGKPMWGTWWIWDARLTSQLILFFLYLAIIFLQSSLAQNANGKRALSIFVLVGFVDIPIIHYSVYWWNTLHQGASLKLFSPSSIDSSMIYPLLAMIVAFLLYYAIILFLHMRPEILTMMATAEVGKERK